MRHHGTGRGSLYATLHYAMWCVCARGAVRCARCVRCGFSWHRLIIQRTDRQTGFDVVPKENGVSRKQPLRESGIGLHFIFTYQLFTRAVTQVTHTHTTKIIQTNYSTRHRRSIIPHVRDNTEYIAYNQCLVTGLDCICCSLTAFTMMTHCQLGLHAVVLFHSAIRHHVLPPTSPLF